jgi:hypothetical protein
LNRANEPTPAFRADSIHATSTPERGSLMLLPKYVCNVTVSKTDIVASNGVIHVIDSVLMPRNLHRANKPRPRGLALLLA